jgi:hypothetical protein
LRLRAGWLLGASCASAISVWPRIAPTILFEVVSDTAGESTDRFRATSLLEIGLQASTFLQQMIPHHDIGDGVVSPLWRHANIRPLVLDVLCEPHRNSSGSDKITLEIRENLIERLEATMRVSILGSTGQRGGGCRQAVVLEDLDPLKVLCQSTGHRQPL